MPLSARTAMPTRRTEITADFPGASYPVGARVRFYGKDGSLLNGAVVGLRIKQADVLTDQGTRYIVAYSSLDHVQIPLAPHCTLEQAAELANRLLARHQESGKLAGGWVFGFDLAPTRAGVCHYSQKRIGLSVNYCLRATPDEIEDTVLHEIAHAMVGFRHNHDAVWKAKALEIGCVGERCHRVEQSIPLWIGQCGCGQQWFRHRLQRRILRNRACPKCRGVITWSPNTELPGS